MRSGGASQRRPNRHSTKQERFELPPIPQLDEELRQLIRLIPAGSVMTCGDLAELLGDRGAARWVGEFVRDESPAASPVHRVVRQTGELTRTGLTHAEACERLRGEGVRLEGQRVVLPDHRQLPSELSAADLQATRPGTRQPLRRLADWQQAFEQRAEEAQAARDPRLPNSAAADCTSDLSDSPKRRGGAPRFVLGVDVSYCGGTAWACCVEYDVEADEVMASRTARIEHVFPYIPGYLAFREAPAMLAAIRRLRRHSRQAGLLLVDGNGRLHPRRAGIACLVGALVDLPTIGVGKSLLCGQRQPDQTMPGCQHVLTLPWSDSSSLEQSEDPPKVEREVVAGEIVPSGSRKPLYVSAGWKISLEQAVGAAQHLRRSHRLPEPLYWADRLSRSAAQSATADIDDRQIAGDFPDG